MHSAPDVALHSRDVIVCVAYRDFILIGRTRRNSNRIPDQAFTLQSRVDGIVPLRPFRVAGAGHVLFVDPIQEQRSRHALSLSGVAGTSKSDVSYRIVRLVTIAECDA